MAYKRSEENIKKYPDEPETGFFETMKNDWNESTDEKTGLPYTKGKKAGNRSSYSAGFGKEKREYESDPSLEKSSSGRHSEHR